jgi:hypothetical protein
LRLEPLAPDPLKIIDPQLPGDVPLVEVNVIGCRDVPLALRMPLTISEAPCENNNIVPGFTVRVMPLLTVTLLMSTIPLQ